MKSKNTLVIIVSVVVLVIAALKIIGWKNHLIELDEQVKQTWSQVENQFQRRADLIPNLVETVKGYASHEKEVLMGVTQARSRVGAAGNPQEKIDANNELTSALSRLLVVMERYPDLKANQNFLALQDEIAGTENRISIERKRYNESAQRFNATIRKIPYSFFASTYKPAPYFESAPGADKAPKIKF